MKPKNVLHLIDSGGPGGAETVLSYVVHGLTGARWSHHVVVPWNGWLQSSLREQGIAASVLPTTGSFDLPYLTGIVKLIRERRVDLVQTHLFTTAVYGSAAGAFCGVPVVSTIHGQIDIGPAGWARGIKLRLLNGRFNRVVFVSERLRRQVLSIAPFLGKRSRLILNGVDCSQFEGPADDSLRRELAVPTGAVLVGAIGNIREPKDYSNLLRAAAELKDSSAPPYRFVVVGDIEADTRLFADLLALRGSLGIEAMVSFTGFRNDIPLILKNLDIYVMSSDREGLPLSLLQGMASSLPVVSTRCGGPEEVIEDGRNGVLVDRGDPAGLAAAIRRLICDRPLAGKFGRAGRATVRSRFSTERMIEQYEELYCQCLGLPPP